MALKKALCVIVAMMATMTWVSGSELQPSAPMTDADCPIDAVAGSSACHLGLVQSKAQALARPGHKGASQSLSITKKQKDNLTKGGRLSAVEVKQKGNTTQVAQQLPRWTQYCDNLNVGQMCNHVLSNSPAVQCSCPDSLPVGGTCSVTCPNGQCASGQHPYCMKSNPSDAWSFTTFSAGNFRCVDCGGGSGGGGSSGAPCHVSLPVVVMGLGLNPLMADSHVRSSNCGLFATLPHGHECDLTCDAGFIESGSRPVCTNGQPITETDFACHMPTTTTTTRTRDYGYLWTEEYWSHWCGRADQDQDGLFTSATLQNWAGNTADLSGLPMLQDEEACADACWAELDCNYFLYKNDPNERNQYRCALFQNCDNPREQRGLHTSTVFKLVKRATEIVNDQCEHDVFHLEDLNDVVGPMWWYDNVETIEDCAHLSQAKINEQLDAAPLGSKVAAYVVAPHDYKYNALARRCAIGTVVPPPPEPTFSGLFPGLGAPTEPYVPNIGSPKYTICRSTFNVREACQWEEVHGGHVQMSLFGCMDMGAMGNIFNLFG